MNKVNSVVQLKESIALLERQQANDEQLLKEQFKITYAALSPANLIKNTFHELVQAPDFKEDILDTAMGIVTGYVSKKIVVGNTQNPIKQIMGIILQLAITSVVSKNADSIKSTIMLFINKMTSKKESADQ